MKIPLTGGRYALIDDSDYPLVAGFKWRLSNPSHGFVYAIANDGKTLMHRLIANTPKGMSTDHINHDTLDNRRDNLRVCTVGENNRNTGSSVGTSRFKGVCKFVQRNGRTSWRAYIRSNGSGSMHLGLFSSEVAAALAYNEAATRLHGAFAKLNEIHGGEPLEKAA